MWRLTRKIADDADVLSTMLKPTATTRAVTYRTRPIARAFVRSGARDVAKELLKVVEDTEQGIRTTKNQREAIQTLVQRLQEYGDGKETTGANMSATWKMKWTTEKETLFILKNCTWFNKAPSDVYQVLDRQNGRLQNVITLDPDSIFMVDSSLEVSSPRRVNFRFTSALYQESDKKPLKLPPFGEGWFENVYLDDEIRVSIDVRRDTLITVRDGPVRTFP